MFGMFILRRSQNAVTSYKRVIYLNLYDYLFKSSYNSTITAQQKRFHGSEGKGEADIEVNYITKDGKKITLFGREGDDVMHLAQRNDIEIEGACEASLACCTCHVYVKHPHFDALEPASEEEEDLLDMAPFLKENSRLSKFC